MFAPDVNGVLELVMRPGHPDYEAAFATEHVTPPDVDLCLYPGCGHNALHTAQTEERP
jgi:hypothetical protein